MTRAERTAEQDMVLIRAEFAGTTGDQAGRFATWWGWRPSKARRCPMVAAGKRCLIDSSWPRLDCICKRYRYPMLDHPRIWLAEDGRHIFTAEPYHFDGQEFARLVADCGQLGLNVHVSGTSPYFPGATCLIYICRAGEDERPDRVMLAAHREEARRDR